MNTDANSAQELAARIVQENKSVQSLEIAVCPPAPLLSIIGAVLQGSRICLGAQNMHWEDSGAFTGEVSAHMLRSVGCRYVILGHSERRQYFGETDAEVSRKVRQAISAGLTPIICVGEHLQQRKEGREREVVAEQVRSALEGSIVSALESCVIAYEPIWAIGTGETATPEQAQSMHAFIRTLVRRQFGEAIAQGIHILYGGSMKPENAKELLSQNDVDGGLIGGASLRSEFFGQIIQAGQDIQTSS